MYHPTGRVLTVLELLQSRPGITGTELADRLETDVRTVRRYIAKLQDVGIPVEANPGRFGGYHLRPGYKLPPLIFTQEEASAMVIALMGSSWLRIDQSQTAVYGAISKITRVLPEGARSRLEALSNLMFLKDSSQTDQPSAALIIDASQAVQAEQVLNISYRAEGILTERAVEPYGIVGRKGYWYLVGWCRLRSAFRTFRFDRIGGHEISGESFKRREDFDFDAYVTEHIETYPGSLEFSVIFKAPLSRVRRKIPEPWGSLEECPEGVLFMGNTDSYTYQAWELVSLDIPFRVLAPRGLKDALLALSDEIRASAQ